MDNKENKLMSVAIQIDTASRKRLVRDKAVRLGVIAITLLTVTPIILIIGKLILQGYKQLNIPFFTETSPDTFQAMMAASAGEVIPGGILNGIAGTLLMTLIASVIAIPVGIASGVYLYDKQSTRYADVVRNITEILQGVPSIILGIIGYLWIVKNVTKGFSALAGSVALAIMMVPLITRSTEETMKMIPGTLREAAFALGVPYHRVILKVLLPTGSSGLMTGILLSFSRIVGETAPLLMTALGSQVVNLNIDKPTSAVPLLVWEFYNDPNMVDLIWSSSLFLMIFVLLMNLLSRRIASRSSN